MAVFPVERKALAPGGQRVASFMRATYDVDVPCGVEFIPVIFPGELISVGSHPCELREGMPVGEIGTKDLCFDPVHGFALGLVYGPPTCMLDCLVGTWLVNSGRDCFQ